MSFPLLIFPSSEGSWKRGEALHQPVREGLPTQKTRGHFIRRLADKNYPLPRSLLGAFFSKERHFLPEAAKTSREGKRADLNRAALHPWGSRLSHVT